MNISPICPGNTKHSIPLKVLCAAIMMITAASTCDCPAMDMPEKGAIEASLTSSTRDLIYSVAVYAAKVGGPQIPHQTPATPKEWEALSNSLLTWFGTQAEDRRKELNTDYKAFMLIWSPVFPPDVAPVGD